MSRIVSSQGAPHHRRRLRRLPFRVLASRTDSRSVPRHPIDRAIDRAGLIGAYVAYAWSLGPVATVWLVNGLAREYDVRIDGKVHHLMPHEAHSIKVSEGQVQVASAHAATPFPDQTCRSPRRSSPARSPEPLFVINPDQTAFVYEEDTLFAAKSQIP